MVKAEIVQGYRLVMQEFEVVSEEVENKICLHTAGLTFIDKEWYLQTIKKKGMVDMGGNRSLKHPDFQSTPVRITRSRMIKMPRKNATGGFSCNLCEKVFKTEKTLETHVKRFH